MKTLSLALAGLFAGVSACSLLLDTGSLQGGKTAGSSGSGGSAGSTGTGGEGGTPTDAGPDAPAKMCSSDPDCLPSGFEVNGCIFYGCGPDKKCAAPAPNTGKLGIVSAGTVETVMTADDIGYPSLLADGSDIIMSVWHRTGMTSDVLIRKYPAYPQGGVGVELSAIGMGMFRSYGSSPGLISKAGLPRKIRLLLAADRGGAAAGMGMRLLDVDVPTLNNNIKLSTVQPVPVDLGVAGYDTPPRAFPPRLMPNGVMEPVGMWMQQQKLFYFDGAMATEEFSAKRVLGFVPLAGAGVHAALQTAEIVGGANGALRTEIWSKGSMALVSLDGDQPGARLGVTATFTNESNLVANILGWSFAPPGGTPGLNYTGAVCPSSMSCASVAFSTQPSVLPYAVFPELTSVRIEGSMIDRDVFQAFEVVFPDVTTDSAQPGIAGTALFGSVARFTIPSSDLKTTSTKSMNPALFPVDVSTVAGGAPGDALGPSSVAITSGGQLLVAWVVHPRPNSAELRARRYRVTACP
jgi:hypothetical protein